MSTTSLSIRRKIHPVPAPDDENGIPPIIFTLPGLEPDVRLRVFDTPIYVHLVILKLYSGYFRAFLKDENALLGRFKFDYVTVIDEDMTWALEPAAKAPILTESMMSRLEPEEREFQLRNFRTLLCAMYNMPYNILSSEQLKDITIMADFYMALRILSSTIAIAFIQNPLLSSHIEWTGSTLHMAAPSLLATTQKLRNPYLFRECFVHTVSIWDKKEKYGILEHIKENDQILAIIQKGYADVNQNQLDAYKILIWFLVKEHGIKTKELKEQLREIMSHEFHLVSPSSATRFRTIETWLKDNKEKLLSIHAEDTENWLEAYYQVTKLMTNNLLFDKSGFGPGEGCYKDDFLCASIEDEDLPWDRDDTDW